MKAAALSLPLLLARLIRPSVIKDPEDIERTRMHDQVYAFITGFLRLDAAFAAAPIEGVSP